MTTPPDPKNIAEHYDLVSPYYRALWGEHLHHGYWTSGRETKEEAQLALTAHLAQAAGIQPGSRILDVGCGFGASSIYLARTFGAEAIGITISRVQVDMAQAAAAQAQVDAQFLLMDAQAMDFDAPFDVLWSIESISHYPHWEQFFQRAARFVVPQGKIALVDWFQKEGISDDAHRTYIAPIERGMMVHLHTMRDYRSLLESKGFRILAFEDLSAHCSKTWDITLDIIKDPALRSLAWRQGREFVRFLRSFRAMKAGFSSGYFVYGLIVAEKESVEA